MPSVAAPPSTRSPCVASRLNKLRTFVRRPLNKIQILEHMKQSVLTSLLVLILACAVPVSAGPGHAHGHTHAAKITGPNKGRILTELEPHAELFVTTERRVRLTFVDDSGKPVSVPANFSAKLITGERSAPVTLNFAADGDTLLSTAPLPEGQNLPVIVRAKPDAAAETVTIRFQLNLAQCGECDRPEYACSCGH